MPLLEGIPKTKYRKMSYSIAEHYLKYNRADKRLQVHRRSDDDMVDSRTLSQSAYVGANFEYGIGSLNFEFIDDTPIGDAYTESIADISSAKSNLFFARNARMPGCEEDTYTLIGTDDTNWENPEKRFTETLVYDLYNTWINFRLDDSDADKLYITGQEKTGTGVPSGTPNKQFFRVGIDKEQLDALES